LGNDACKKGYAVGFWRTAALVNRLRAEQKNGTLEAFLKNMAKYDFIILDKWGYVPPSAGWCKTDVPGDFSLL